MINRQAYPDRLIMDVPNLDEVTASYVAADALLIARTIMPKLSGTGARNLRTVYGQGYFGLRWTDNYVWFQEEGINAFTMRSLAGKTIPMWIDDPTGIEARRYPKNAKRITASGKRQVLIFRRAARQGERKTVTRRVAGQDIEVSVPRSYPGAPGRIASREAAKPWTTTGKVGGQIRVGNVGVRWRHPGLMPRRFLRHAIEMAAYEAGLNGRDIRAEMPMHRAAA